MDVKREAAKMEEFEYVRHLGEGSFGRVHLARHATTGAYFAIKQAKTGTKRKLLDAHNSLLSTEGRLLGQMSHPNVVRLFKTIQNEGACGLVLEFVAGLDLAAMLQKGPLKEKQAAEIYKAFLEGLAHIHAKGIIHRDLKPSRQRFKQVTSSFRCL